MKLTHSAAFIAGVAAAPLVLVGVEVVNDTYSAAIEHLREMKTNGLDLHDDHARSLNAAAIMYATRVAAITLPGGIVLAWRSKVPWRIDVTEFAANIREMAREMNR